MARMKTFLLYLLGIVGFIFLSTILEDALIENMYYEMAGEVSSSSDIIIEDNIGKATNVNGYMQFKVSNKSNKVCDDYVKVDLYSKQGLLAETEYIKITDLEPGHAKNYQLKLKGNEFASYKLAVVEQAPDKSNIIDLFGWEVDLTNVLGMDLTNFSLFGVRLADIFDINNIKTAGGNAWNLAKSVMQSVPWWGYAIASGIILWYMPKGFLFGIFPL